VWYKAAVAPLQRAMRRARRPRGARAARVTRLAIFTAALGLLLAACTRGLPQNSLDPAGPVAERQYELFTLVFWIAVGVFVIVEGLLVFALFRFRHREGREPRQIHGNTRLEVAWTIVPAVLLAGVAVPTVATIFDLASEPPSNAVEITVTGHQWWWEVEYPDQGVVTANEIHVPTDRPVHVTLTSEDVIHSFWVPRLAGKQDLVPGQTETLTFTAPTPGTYRGTCTEYCGLSHANMRFRVIAQEPGEFEAWVQDQLGGVAAMPPTEIENTVTGTCMSCHVIRGLEARAEPATPAPDLTHIGSRQTIAAGLFPNSPEDLARWLADPPAVKPGSKMPDYNLTEEQIDALVEYLGSLR
jgi:cytochrome c oxidase subunit II